MNFRVIAVKEKDYFELYINEDFIGTLERSQLRHLIQVIDNAI